MDELKSNVECAGVDAAMGRLVANSIVLMVWSSLVHFFSHTLDLFLYAAEQQ